MENIYLHYIFVQKKIMTPAKSNKTTKTTAKPKKSSNKSKTKKEVSHEEIRFRAYEIYLSRGGSPEENWLQAEKELLGLLDD